MAAKGKKGANRAAPGKKVEVGNMLFWRELAQAVVEDLDPKDESDSFELGEVAVILQQVCSLLGQEHENISKTCNRNEDKTVTVSFAAKFDRRTTPPEVGVTISYAQKHRSSMKAKVPDPNQTELPGLTETEVAEDAELPESETKEA